MTACSGIGAPETASPEIDWRLACEIDRFPRAVLRARFGCGDLRRGSSRHGLWGDFTALRVRHLRRFGLPIPNLIVAGTPCQSFSIAGLRQSLADPRGNLTLQFVRMVNAVRRASEAESSGKRPVFRWLVWENVRDVLSTPDNAFGCFLAGIVGADDPVPAPNGGRWPRVGMVAGPRARAAWRVFDAQHFGLAQRRKRVFVIAGFGDDADPAAILFERRSLRRDSAPRRQAGKDVAGALAARTSAGGGLGTDFDLDGGLIASTGDVAHCLNAGAMRRIDYETETMIAHALRADGFDASEDGTGRGTPIVPVAMNLRGRAGGASPEIDDLASLRAASGGSSRSYVCFDETQVTSRTNRSNPQHGDPAHPLTAHGLPPTIAFSSKDHGADACNDLSPTVRAGVHSRSHANAGVPPAATTPSGVRRLTVRECARLQGFPDDHTLISGYGGAVYKDDADRAEMAAYLGFNSTSEMLDFDPPADGPQYRGYGNSMAVPVMRWILDRIRRADGDC